MKIYKFGGASVRNPESVKNVLNVLRVTQFNQGIIVISAMGKTTNALEEVLNLYRNQGNYSDKIDEIKEMHSKIAYDLMPENEEIQTEIKTIFENLNTFFQKNKSEHYSYIYDQVVSKGELLSTKIVSAFLNQEELSNEWLDARDYIKTDSTYREGKVNWGETQKRLKEIDPSKLYITQGFIGSNENYQTTTLGREGSDYTGAIFAYGLDAESLSIWKDVPGVLNADPRSFEDTIILEQIPYDEAIELAYYGASVIHPKTLQPLQQKGIPLYVKCFDQPTAAGSVIQQADELLPETPCYIVKKKQFVLNVSTKSFAFIDESVIKNIFHLLSEHQLKVNLMQISAISLSLCLEDKYQRLYEAMQKMENDYALSLHTDCLLYTIRHYKAGSEKCINQLNKTLIRQSGKDSLQLVIKK